MSKKQKPTFEDYDYLGHSASAHDQTGLIPSGVVDEAQLESYDDLYPFPPPIVKKDEDHAH